MNVVQEVFELFLKTKFKSLFGSSYGTKESSFVEIMENIKISERMNLDKDSQGNVVLYWTCLAIDKEYMKQRTVNRIVAIPITELSIGFSKVKLYDTKKAMFIGPINYQFESPKKEKIQKGLDEELDEIKAILKVFSPDVEAYFK